jgi:hypothetical protein
MKKILISEAFTTFHFDERYLERLIGKELGQKLNDAVGKRVETLKYTRFPKGNFVVNLFFIKKLNEYLIAIVRNSAVTTTFMKKTVKSDTCFQVADLINFRNTLRYLRSSDVPKGLYYYEYKDYRVPFFILVKDNNPYLAVSAADLEKYPDYKKLN